MKAISLWQPWAQLAALGVKPDETRGWPTNYRGPIAIHAAKKPVAPIFRMLQQGCPVTFEDIKRALAYGPIELPLGAVVAIAMLTDVFKIRRWDMKQHKGDLIVPRPTLVEQSYGDYTPGRFAWRLENVLMLPEPIPAKGQQGLWDWDQDFAPIGCTDESEKDHAVKTWGYYHNQGQKLYIAGADYKEGDEWKPLTGQKLRSLT